jgi:adenine-specific DNA-methyltransferase
MDKLDLQTPNFTNENIQKLSELFPNCVTEDGDGKTINFDLLKQELSNHIVEGNKERYELSWPGKAESLVTANIPINKTLRPNREESKDFDNTENLYIEGDNLEALKLLQETYLGKVKMIYIDPPYNTGNDFVYRDSFTKDKAEFDEESRNVDDEGRRLVSNPRSNGRYHSDWLSMMYPRLKLARNLMRDDGVIFISIDDNEISNLKSLCDEVFGGGNFIAQFVVQTNPRGRSLDRYVAKTFEYIICYAKDFGSDCLFSIPKDEKALKEYKNEDQNGKYRPLELRNRNPVFNRGNRPNLYYPIYINPEIGSVSLEKSDQFNVECLPLNSKNEDGCWTWGKDKVTNENALLFGKRVSTGNWRVYRKDYIPKDGATTKEKSLWLDSNLNNENGKEEIGRLFNTSGNKTPFDFPKSVDLIKKCIKIAIRKEGLVLDFFSGSATNAQAVMQLNADDGGNRKFIMVQIPEATNEESEAYKAGYKTIAEIGKERIRRAGEKIKKDNAEKENIDNLDIGFRVLKVDSSNMKDVYFTPDQTNQSNILDLASNIKEDRNSEDLLFMVLLSWGIDLSSKIEKKEIEGKEVYFVDDNYLAACFDENIDEQFVKTLIDDQPLKVVLRDSSFASSSVKINVEQIFVQANIEAKVI